MKKVVSVLICVVIILQFCSCVPAGDTKVTENITAMNTVMQITVFNTSKGTAEEVAEKMIQRIKEIEKLFDANLSDSDTSRINSAVTELTVNDETAELLNTAKKASETTGGAFDITIMPVLKLWGFNDGNYGVADDETIKDFLEFVDYKNISVAGNKVTKNINTQISLGGIAKGYLGDELLEIAEEYGATALLSLGGNIVLCGNKSESEKWTVGIKNPNDTENIACSFECDGNKSVVTSGAYERYFEYGGKTYHHIIDPNTGYPAHSDLLSVTVIGENGAFCDAFSTALFVMGKEKSVAFAKEHNEFDFILITENSEILITDGVTDIESENFTVKSIQR